MAGDDVAGQAKRLFRKLRRRETEDYPGLVVCDDRVSGSITAGASRLPLWGLTRFLFGPWEEAIDDYGDVHGWDDEQFKSFVHSLLEHRGEIGRLICVLADVERRESERSENLNTRAWYERASDRKRVITALRNAIQVLEETGTPWALRRDVP